MESPIKGRTVIDIGETAAPSSFTFWVRHSCHLLWHWEKNGDQSPRGQTTPCLLLVMLLQTQLMSSKATTFMAACSGKKKVVNMSETRVQLWAVKNGKGVTSSPKLCTLPPMTEAFLENVKQAGHSVEFLRKMTHLI